MIEIKQGDCLELMKYIPDKSIDMILCDLPYGTTACKWDSIIPFALLWENYKRIIKDNGAIVLFGCEPFTSQLICSNIEYFKYNWIWVKDKPTGHLNAEKQPMRAYETINVFYKNQCTYNPQYSAKEKKHITPDRKPRKNTELYGDMSKETKRKIPKDMSYPKNVIFFNRHMTRKIIHHPTEKPVNLLEYLIKTYTNEGEKVLDNCMGSGSTGVACVNTGRSFIGIELNEEYYNIAKERIELAKTNKEV